MTRTEHIQAVAFCTRGCQICDTPCTPTIHGVCLLCARMIEREHKFADKRKLQAGHSHAWKRLDDAPRWPRKVAVEHTFPETFNMKDLPEGEASAVAVLSLLYGPRSVEAVELLGKIRRHCRKEWIKCDIAQALNETILIMDEPRPTEWPGLLGIALMVGAALVVGKMGR